MSVILKLISRFGVLWIEISGGFCRNRKCKGSWVVEAILKKGAVRRNSFLNSMYNVCVWWMGTHTTAHMEGRRRPCRVNPLLPLCGDLIGSPGLGGIWGIAQAKEKCYAFRMKSWVGYLALSWWSSFGGCVGCGALLEEGGGLLVKAHLVPVELCFLIRTIEQAVANLLSHTPITMCPSPAIPVAVTDNIGPQPETKVNLSQVKLLLKDCFLFKCVWVFYLGVFLCTLCLQYQGRPEEGTRSAGLKWQKVVTMWVLSIKAMSVLWKTNQSSEALSQPSSPLAGSYPSGRMLTSRVLVLQGRDCVLSPDTGSVEEWRNVYKINFWNW